MASFTEAAYKILKEENQPLQTSELVKRALDKGMISTKGKTPIATIETGNFCYLRRKLKTLTF